MLASSLCLLRLVAPRPRRLDVRRQLAAPLRRVPADLRRRQPRAGAARRAQRRRGANTKPVVLAACCSTSACSSTSSTSSGRGGVSQRLAAHRPAPDEHHPADRRLVLHVPGDQLRDRRPTAARSSRSTRSTSPSTCSFFPHLVAGPLVRAAEFAAPAAPAGPTRARIDATRAFRLIVAGLFKKVVVSRYLASTGSSTTSSPTRPPQRARDPVRHLRLHVPDLRRLLRLHRHRHRPRPAARHPLPAELRPPVPIALEPAGVLAPLAHDAVAVAARLPLHLARRQPQRRAGAPTATCCSRCSSAASGTAPTGRSSCGARSTGVASPVERFCHRQVAARWAPPGRSCDGWRRSTSCASAWIFFEAGLTGAGMRVAFDVLGRSSPFTRWGQGTPLVTFGVVALIAVACSACQFVPEGYGAHAGATVLHRGPLALQGGLPRLSSWWSCYRIGSVTPSSTSSSDGRHVSRRERHEPLTDRPRRAGDRPLSAGQVRDRRRPTPSGWRRCSTRRRPDMANRQLFGLLDKRAGGPGRSPARSTSPAPSTDHDRRRRSLGRRRGGDGDSATERRRRRSHRRHPLDATVRARRPCPTTQPCADQGRPAPAATSPATPRPATSGRRCERRAEKTGLVTLDARLQGVVGAHPAGLLRLAEQACRATCASPTRTSSW